MTSAMGWGRGAFFATNGLQSQKEPCCEKNAPSPSVARDDKGTGRIFASPDSALPTRAGENAPRPSFIRPLMIGPLVVDPPILQAPMAGFTNYAYRQIVHRLGGVGLPATEMVSARGFLGIDARRGELHERLWGVKDEPRPLAAQIWDNDPATLAAVGQRLAHEFQVSVVDLNFGCPVRDVSEKAQSGSYLLRDPDRVGRIVASVVAASAGAGDGQDPPGLHPRHDQRD